MSTSSQVIQEDRTINGSVDVASSYIYPPNDTREVDISIAGGESSDNVVPLTKTKRVVQPVQLIEPVNRAYIEEIKQKWLGTVLDADGVDITARIEDLTDTNNPDEIIVFSVEEIEARDLVLVQEGAMFFWYIGYRKGLKYPKERFSKISFRRLPQWRDVEVKIAADLADKYYDFIHGDNHKPSR